MENWDQNLLVESTEDRRVVNIADVIMGGGKTSAAIRYINQSPPDEKILFVSPYNKDRESLSAERHYGFGGTQRGKDERSALQGFLWTKCGGDPYAAVDDYG